MVLKSFYMFLYKINFLEKSVDKKLGNKLFRKKFRQKVRKNYFNKRRE